jgi:hypothetical protein
MGWPPRDWLLPVGWLHGGRWGIQRRLVGMEADRILAPRRLGELFRPGP